MGDFVLMLFSSLSCPGLSKHTVKDSVGYSNTIIRYVSSLVGSSNIYLRSNAIIAQRDVCLGHGITHITMLHSLQILSIWLK